MTALLISYVLLATAQITSYGRFTPHALILVVLGTGAGAWGVFGERAAAGAASKAALVFGLCAVLLASMAQNPFTYCRVAWWPAVYVGTLLIALCLIVTYLVEGGSGVRRWRGIRFAMLLAIVMSGRVAVPILSPSPGEDVWVVGQEAARAALTGSDPYSVSYSQIFAPQVYEIFGYRSGFHYPPITLLPILPAYAIFGDIRWAYVACELVLLGALWWCGGPAARARRHDERELMVLLWGFNASVLFVLEHGWTEPMGLALLAGFLIGTQRKRIWPAGLCLAGFFSYKQYTLLMFPLLLFLPAAWPLLVCFVALTVASYLPWIVTGPGGLVSSLMEPWRARPRADALSLAALWMQLRQAPMPQWISPICLLGGMSLALGRIVRNERGLLLALWTVLSALFLTAKQSFCNYYYLLSYLVLAAAVLGEEAAGRPDASVLHEAASGDSAAAALREEAPGAPPVAVPGKEPDDPTATEGGKGRAT